MGWKVDSNAYACHLPVLSCLDMDERQQVVNTLCVRYFSCKKQELECIEIGDNFLNRTAIAQALRSTIDKIHETEKLL